MRLKWTEDELVLTLYVYLNYPKDSLFKTSELQIDFRNRLERYTGISRSINSIDLRIANYKSVDPNYQGKGMSGGGKEVARIFKYYKNHTNDLKKKFDDFLFATNQYILEEAVEEIENIKKVSYDDLVLITQDAYIKYLINQRNGKLQKYFKDGLINEFGCRCSLCGINDKQLLIASHIIPYSKCVDKKDMINHNNGLLLCPNHDSLFDKGLITFKDNGQIIISKIINENLYNLLNIDKNYCLDKKYLSDERIDYLRVHRKKYFIDKI